MKKSLLLILLPTALPGATLYSFSTANAAIPNTNDDGYDASVVSISSAANITGPVDGTGLATGNNGLNRFWNSEWAGFSVSSTNGTSLDDSTEFNTGYFELTITAAAGYQLNLESLDFGSARGGSSEERGFALYAKADGSAFALGDTPEEYMDPEASITGQSYTGEPGLRGNTRPVSVDLSGAEFQNINTVTFRYYSLTPATGNSMDFDGWSLEGTVVPIPEPSAAWLSLCGVLALGLRRRK
ncbi:MAG: hypothetical protein ACQKBY_07260 [Verrucomicrobiales bacterium]